MKMITGSHKDLLLAAFSKHSGAWEAFHRWNAGVDWNGEISQEIVRVLPFICQNLRGLGYEHPLFPRFMGVERKIWVENQTVKKNLAEWLPGGGGGIGEDQVAFLALPPTSFLFDNALRYPLYRSHLRFAFYSAVDAVRGIRALLDQGWVPNDGLILPKHWLEGVVWGMDHLGMHRGQGEWLSLTWRMETWFGSRWKEVWSGAESICLCDKLVRVMCATDSMEFLLRQTCGVESFRWLTNVLMMQTKGVAWDELRTRLRENPLRPDAAELVRLVGEFVDFSILPEAGHAGGWENQAAARVAGIGLIKRLKMAWRRFRSYWPQGVSGIRALGQFPGYVIGRWQVRHRMKRRGRGGGEL
jgi:hypothetical protein